MDEFNCVICNREFKSKEALEMHNNSKHYKAPKTKLLDLDNKKLKKWSIFLIIILLVGFGGYFLVKSGAYELNSCETAPVTEINIGSHQNVKLHIHSELDIIINGIEQVIPANIGVSTGVMRPIHTHDSSGEVHMEGPCQRDFILGEFFDVWEKEFNETCLLDKCNGNITMSVNGVKNEMFGNYIMRDDDKIVIEYFS